MFNKIDRIVLEQIKKGKKNFAIYPFGKNGVMTKEILNLKYGVQEALIVDNELCKTNPNVICLEQVENYEDYTWLITCSNPVLYGEIQKSIKDLIPRECIVYLFEYKNYCVVCGHHIESFEPYGIFPRPNAKCPVCWSLERARAWSMYYKDKCAELKKEGVVLLHFAPEKALRPIFSAAAKENYYPVDIDPEREGIRDVIDITNIAYEDKKFDMIVCNHVLEHIKEEEKALLELSRVLKDDGKIFLSVPFTNRKETFEKDEYNTEELRIQHYGHPDHVRLYGLDVSERLEKFFLVKKMDCINELGFSEEECHYFGLMKQEIIWVLEKKKRD